VAGGLKRSGPRRRQVLAACLAASGLPRGATAEVVPTGWSLHSDAARYDIAVRDNGVVCHLYAPGMPAAAWPPPSDAPDDAMVALAPASRPPASQSPASQSPASQSIASQPMASQPIAWRLVSWHQPDAAGLVLGLRGATLPIEAEVAFALDAPTGLVRRSTRLRHDGTGPPLDIGATLAFLLVLHEPIERVLYLSGDWAAETQVQREHASDEPLSLESRSGQTGFGGQPYIALRAATATYVCQLFWSGNWRLQMLPNAGAVVLRGGLNPWGFRHRLRPGGELQLPDMVFGRVIGGVNQATQCLHFWRRARRPDPGQPIPVQFNSWYPYFGEPSAEAMLRLIPLARELGCEAFVVDAGWHRTDDDDSALDWELRTGDWRVSRSRFPNGLGEIGAACQAAGMRFGLWFEPEVIAPLSAVRREHPEWLHHINGEPPADDARAILNLGVPAAWQHAFDRVTRVLRFAGVGWMKWDFNGELGAGGWAPGLPDTLTDADPLVAHYLALYRLQDAIRAAFPELLLEMCASGGGRMDGAILSHAHVNWISDQPGPLRKLAIHFGSLLAHPPEVCNDWLVEWPPGNVPGYDAEPPGLEDRGDLLFRLHVAMLGSFGISARVDRWPDADHAIAAAQVALYKQRLRPIIRHGTQFLLTHSPPVDGAGNWAAVWYWRAEHSEGVLFVFRLAGSQPERRFALPGPAPGRSYRVSWQDGGTMLLIGAALLEGVTARIDTMFRSELCLVQAA
jgi:alpha-galactosidase